MIWLLAVLPVALLVLGVPVFLVLLTSVIVALAIAIDVPHTVIHQVMVGSVSNFALMAVPFFFFAGEMMTRGGISSRIVGWVQSLVGGIRGSLGLTTVGACTMFGAISGSSPATVAAIGSLMHGPLRAAGYNERFSTALFTSSGGIAIVIPPSITMILYGASAEQAVNLLFIAGFLPGLLLATAMGLYVYGYSIRHQIPRGPTFNRHRLFDATKTGLWALLMPVVVLGGIYSGIFSPTEAGGVAALYAVVICRYVYRTADWHAVVTVAVRSVYLTAQIFIIVAAAGLFSWVLTISGATRELLAFFAAIDVAPWLGLLIINVLLLIVGCLVDPASAILVLTPILAPVAQSMGVDLIHFGIIMTINIEIGMFTPPFGLNIFVAQAITRTPVIEVYRGLVPLIIVNIIVLMIVTYWADLSLTLVRLVG